MKQSSAAPGRLTDTYTAADGTEYRVLSDEEADAMMAAAPESAGQALVRHWTEPRRAPAPAVTATIPTDNGGAVDQLMKRIRARNGNPGELF